MKKSYPFMKKLQTLCSHHFLSYLMQQISMKGCKSRWSTEEDELLIKSVNDNGTSNWTLVSSYLKNRTGKQCRERWANHLNPILIKDEWTIDDDALLIKLVNLYGHQWSTITKGFRGRSINSVKNRFGWLKRHTNYFNNLYLSNLTRQTNKRLPEVILCHTDNSDSDNQINNSMTGKYSFLSNTYSFPKNTNRTVFPQLSDLIPFESKSDFSISAILAH
ncbi:Myb-like transcription factor [Tritrichomonas foetus]|uniref:Myb-like transcription factor n=1 Tax=Tritrichomonas foetus TaxID=1144522 RepID=A0A1J4JUK0_9EUKA|nr:Myb-like transcription factor [Tritrichomonas foetus]|eukprot:OHT00925.1 Myb-like transcription factor [Tritrichomonas foetus]